MTKATELREITDDALEQRSSKPSTSCTTCVSARHRSARRRRRDPLARREVARIHTVLREREIAAPEALREDNVMADERREPRANSRKVREGIVVPVKMDKTVVVAVVDRVRHPRYRKTVQRTKQLYAHDEANDVREGDRVRVSRPVRCRS